MSSYDAINWNRVEDPIDKQVWERLTANFWLDTKVPISNDLGSWNKMTPAEKQVVKDVFGTLTLLDTYQGNLGVPPLKDLAETLHAKAVFSNIEFIEQVHAKSYSTIFSTLCSTEEIDEIFRKTQEDELLIREINVLRYLMLKNLEFAASVFLESFLFYSGFFAPLKFAAEGRLTNTADIIRLIMRDEGVHGYYSGYQQQKLHPLDENDKHELEDALLSLYGLECQRAERIYDGVGWTEEVKAYLRFNANRALANLGMGPLFKEDSTKIPAYIMSSLDIGTGESHDFFSGSGASYVIGETEETEDEDWSW